MLKLSRHLTLLASLVFSASCLAANDDAVISVVAENDVITGSDRHYTSGFLLSYVSGLNLGPRRAKNIAHKLPMIDEDDDLHIGLSIGHEIYTPRNIDDPNLIATDRPYAGHLYAAADFTVSNRRSLSTWRLSLGMVGPSSKAKQIQTNLHRRIGSPEPRGWDNQLKDELAYAFVYEKQWRPLCDSQCKGWGADLLPHTGASLGNVSTHANVGAIFRVGRNLGSDYGPPRIRPALPGSLFFKPSTDGTTWYLYAGVDGRYVAHNIFLDGNTHKNSHSVDRRKWVGDVQIGFVLNTQHFRLAYSHVVRSREFEGQPFHNRFGSLTLATRF